MTKTLTALFATAAVILLAAPASAAEYKVNCSNGAVVTVTPKMGPGSEPLLNIEPNIVGVQCHDGSTVVYAIRGIDGVTLPDMTSVNRLMRQAGDLFAKPKTAQNVGAPTR